MFPPVAGEALLELLDNRTNRTLNQLVNEAGHAEKNDLKPPRA
ncbi:MAG: hypothetical protein U0840_25720 [Gemmataceae bacterium]